MMTKSFKWLFGLRKSLFCHILLIVSFISCEKEEAELIDNLSIEHFEPLAGLQGDTITIFGTGFNREAVRNVVQFSSTKEAGEIPLAKVISSSETEIKAIVPAFTESGFVKIGVGPYSALSRIAFLLSPSISVVEPESAKPGDQVTIGGQNFTADTSALVLFVGNVKIDSIFGASTSQIAFPLPFNIPPGKTQIRLGIKIQEDTVFAPLFEFTVIDADNPNLISVDPREGTPGTEITLFGANFNPDETTVTFGNIPISEFVNITAEQITFSVPNLASGLVNVTVTTRKSNGQIATTAPLTFTVLEIVIIPPFYWSFSHRLDGSPSGIQQIVEGQKKLLPNFGSYNYKGIALSTDKSTLYILNGSYDPPEMYKVLTSTFTSPSIISLSNLDFAGEMVFHDNKLYYTRTGGDKGIWLYEPLITPKKQPTKLFDLQIASGDIIATTRAANMKVAGSFLYWTESFIGNTAVVRADLGNAAAPQILFSNPTHTPLNAVVAIAIDITTNTIFIVNSPHDDDTGIILQNSVIYKGSLGNPAAALEVLHNGTVGKITDIQFNEEDGMLYYMNYAEDATGGIFKISLIPGSSPVKVVEGIAYGAYFDF